MKHLRWTLPLGVLLLWAAGLAARVPGGEPHLSRPPGRAALPHVDATPRRVLSTTASRARQAPVVEVEALNPGTTLARGLCLTVAVGAGAASECGDLRLAHALPAVQTLGRGRAPVLLYSSQHATPHPVVAAHVTLPGGTADLRRVDATLRVNGQPRAQGIWKGTLWPTSGAARIAVGFDASADVTGPYRYTLEVRAHYGTATVASTVRGQLVVVNRRESALGAGWAVAGVERLVMDPFGQPALWVGGDGSTRRYTPLAGDTLWSAPPLDGPDLLRRAGSGWERVVSGGTRVVFDSAGRHVGTRNRLGHETSFLYDGEGRLFRIQVPPAASGLAYTFVYGADGRLDRVEAPDTGSAPRVVTVHGGGLRVDSISDPDGTRVRFGYADAAGRRVVSRTNRLGHTTLFRYDAGGRVASSRVDLENGDSIVWRLRGVESLGLAAGDGSGATDTTLAYARLDGPRTDVGDTTALWLDRFGAPRRIRNALGHETLLTRADSRFPALVTQVNAPGANGTRLVTYAAYSSRGLTDSVTVVNPLGDGRNATTHYQWHPRWDAPTRVTAPEGDVTTFGYDDITGHRLWAQAGPDPARRATFGYYPLNDAQAPGLPGWVKAPLTNQETYEYDARGNLSAVVDPAGQRTERHTDRLGQDTLVVSPIDVGKVQRAYTYYNSVGLVDSTRVEGPAVTYVLQYWESEYHVPNSSPAEAVHVRNEYDLEGRLKSVSRHATPDTARIGTVTTRWEYDALGRQVKEFAPDTTPNILTDNPFDRTVYDKAGNPTEVHTRRGHVIRMTYDTLGRLRTRVVPEVTEAPVTERVLDASIHKHDTSRAVWTFPLRSSDAEGNLTRANHPDSVTTPGPLVIRADTSRFRYDGMGNLTRAANRDAIITRTYNPNGSLATETQRIRSYAGMDTTTHTYTLGYGYDLQGRRTRLTPEPGFNLPTGDISYSYDDETGALATVSSGLGQTHRFWYDAAGRPDSSLLGGFVRETSSYDVAGRLQGQKRWRGSQLIQQDAFDYDARGKIVQAGTLNGSVTNTYAGLGALVHSYTYIGQNEINPQETYTSDALGNSVLTARFVRGAREDVSRASPEFTGQIYEPYTGRLKEYREARGDWLSRRDSMRYDRAGNRVAEWRGRVERGYTGLYINEQIGDQVLLAEQVRMYYGADQKLRAVDRRSCAFGRQMGWEDPPMRCWEPYYGSRPALEEYRYDALGRRVLTRTDQSWACWANCVNGVTRTIWDGDQILYEVRAPAVAMEQDVVTAEVPDRTQYGRVAYVHGPGIDRPLSLVRMDFLPQLPQPEVILPHANWRGSYETGTFLSTGQAKGYCFKEPAHSPNDWEGTYVPYETSEVDHTSGVDSVTTCVDVSWPAQTRWMTHMERPLERGYGGPRNWMGSLIEGGLDVSGQMYMRNRYYDPKSGRFTQEDPIGIAGGLNVYGFANGDPVSYSDPYGLNPFPRCISIGCSWIGIIQKEGFSGLFSRLSAAAEVGMFGAALISPVPGDEALIGARFAQRTYSETFSAAGRFAGRSIDDVADALRSGSLGVDDLPVDYIVREGKPLILNTRSAQALERAGVSRAQWKGVNRTGVKEFEDRLSDQLRRNRLDSNGTETVRSSGKKQ